MLAGRMLKRIAKVMWRTEPSVGARLLIEEICRWRGWSELERDLKEVANGVFFGRMRSRVSTQKEGTGRL